MMAELNKAQREAVTTPPDAILQILAGPGSGKTKVLTHRVCYLLEEGLKPENIILTTFTNVFRILKFGLCLESCKRDEREDCKVGWERCGITINHRFNFGCLRTDEGTFHSICRRYLVKYGPLINLPKGFGIADSDDTYNHLRSS